MRLSLSHCASHYVIGRKTQSFWVFSFKRCPSVARGVFANKGSAVASGQKHCSIHHLLCSAGLTGPQVIISIYISQVMLFSFFKIFDFFPRNVSLSLAVKAATTGRTKHQVGQIDCCTLTHRETLTYVFHISWFSTFQLLQPRIAHQNKSWLATENLLLQVWDVCQQSLSNGFCVSVFQMICKDKDVGLCPISPSKLMVFFITEMICYHVYSIVALSVTWLKWGRKEDCSRVIGLLRAKTRVRLEYSLKVVFIRFIAEEKQQGDNREPVQIRVVSESCRWCAPAPPYQLPLQIKEAPSDEAKSAYTSTGVDMSRVYFYMRVCFSSLVSLQHASPPR